MRSKQADAEARALKRAARERLGARVRSLAREGCTPTEIAISLGVSHGTVYAVLATAGITPKLRPGVYSYECAP